jgi:hypothetical protein
LRAENGILPKKNRAGCAMHPCCRLEFMFYRLHKIFRIARAAGRTLITLCVFITLAGRTTAAESSSYRSPASSPAFNSVFAIADFDGDRKPDLAIVEMQSSNSSTATQYSIRFQLTAGAAQSFGVSAPAGGLQIVARDVNGDDAQDLLVSTAWLHQEVAVLLNDGHGNFTLANPSAFPAAIWQCAASWESGACPQCDSVALVRSEYSAKSFAAMNRFQCLESQTGSGAPDPAHGKALLLLFSLLGRAPPIFVFQA